MSDDKFVGAFFLLGVSCLYSSFAMDPFEKCYQLYIFKVADLIRDQLKYSSFISNSESKLDQNLPMYSKHPESKK